jgi:hypothetical protein
MIIIAIFHVIEVDNIVHLLEHQLYTCKYVLVVGLSHFFLNVSERGELAHRSAGNEEIMHINFE